MPYTKGGGRNCAVSGCFNDQRKLHSWRESLCIEHGNIPKRDCPCLEPFGFHRFPTNEEGRKAWISALNRKDFAPNKSSAVCSRHFIDGRPSQQNPLPEIHLGYSKEVFQVPVFQVCSHPAFSVPVIGITDLGKKNSTTLSVQNVIGTTDPGKNSSTTAQSVPRKPLPKAGQYCSSLNCGKARGRCTKMSFFAFPRNKERSKIWVQNCRRLDLMKKTPEQLRKSYRFCADHFEDSQFMNSNKRDRLIWNAIPTLFNVPNPPKRIEVKRPLPQKRGLQTDVKTYYRKDGKYITTCTAKPSRTSTADEKCLTNQQNGRSTVTTFVNAVPVLGCVAVEDNNDAANIRIEAVHSNYQRHEDANPTDKDVQTVLPTSQHTMKAGAVKSTCQCADPVCAQEKKQLLERLKKMKRERNAFRSVKYRLNRKIKKMQEEKENVSLDAILSSLKEYLNDELLELVTTQLLIASSRKKQVRWSDKMKNFCLSVYRSGSKAYKNMSKIVSLPALKVLQRYEKEMKNLVVGEETVPKEDVNVAFENQDNLSLIEIDPQEMEVPSLICKDLQTDARNTDIEIDANDDLLTTVVIEECVDNCNDESRKESKLKLDRNKPPRISILKSSFPCKSEHNNCNAELRLASAKNEASSSPKMVIAGVHSGVRDANREATSRPLEDKDMYKTYPSCK